MGGVSEADYPPTRPNWIKDEDDAVHLGLGVYVSPGLTAKIPTELGGVTMQLQLIDRRYVVRTFKITRHGEMVTPPITSELLRRVRVQELVNENVPAAIRVYEPGSDEPRDAVLTTDERDRLVSAGPNDELLRWVGRLYLLGQALGTGQAKYVRDVLDVPASTAGNWVRRAKDRGFIHG